MQTTQGNNTKQKKLTVFQDERELQKFLEQNFTESLKQLIKVTVTTMVKAEMEQVREQMTDKPQFNGYYDRHLTSSFGRVEDIPLPRFRQTKTDLNLQSLGVFDSEQAKFAHLIQQMHLLGISQRKIERLAKTVFGIPISKNRVGIIYKELADKEEVNINHQILDDTYEYLLLDGIWEKTKGYGWDDNDSVILCALGIRPDGVRKILGFALCRAEHIDGWSKLLSSLKDRGLKGRNLKLAIADDSGGLKAALSIYYPIAPLQNCIVHKMRNVLKRVSHKNKMAVAEDVKSIFTEQTKFEATIRAKAVARKWYLTEPKAVESLRHNIEYCFTYLDFPKEHWSKIRTTNILEREFRELRRRMKVFDNTFQNEESANRYANTLFTYLNHNYPLNRSLHTKA